MSEERKIEIDRLTKLVEEKSKVVEQNEKKFVEEVSNEVRLSNKNEPSVLAVQGRITHELLAIGAQCKGEKHEQTIGRQRIAVNELRTRLKKLEKCRPENPSYEKILGQVSLLKRELAEMRARSALPPELSFLETSSANNSFHHNSTNSLDFSLIEEEKSSQFDAPEVLRNFDDLVKLFIRVVDEKISERDFSFQYNSLTKSLLALLELKDESLLDANSIFDSNPEDRENIFHRRKRTADVLLQKVEVRSRRFRFFRVEFSLFSSGREQMLKERIERKEELLQDYEKDLARLRQAEIVIREKDSLIEQLQNDKRSKDDETLFLRTTLKQVQDDFNKTKRPPSAKIKRSSSEKVFRREFHSNKSTEHFSLLFSFSTMISDRTRTNRFLPTELFSISTNLELSFSLSRQFSSSITNFQLSQFIFFFCFLLIRGRRINSI